MLTYQWITLGIALIINVAGIAYSLGRVYSKIDSNRENGDLKNKALQTKIHSVQSCLTERIDRLDAHFTKVIENGLTVKQNDLEKKAQDQHDRLLSVENNVKWIKKRLEQGSGDNN